MLMSPTDARGATGDAPLFERVPVPGATDEWLALHDGRVVAKMRPNNAGGYHVSDPNDEHYSALNCSRGNVETYIWRCAYRANCIPDGDGHYRVEHTGFMAAPIPIVWERANRVYQSGPGLPYVIHPHRAVSKEQMMHIIGYLGDRFGDPDESTVAERWDAWSSSSLVGFRDVADLTLFLLDWQGRKIPVTPYGQKNGEGCR